MKIKSTFKITNKLGFHARPAMDFMRLAQNFSSDITLSLNGRKANAKSIMEIMMLAAGSGSVINIEVSGEDAEEAIRVLTGFQIVD